MDRIKLIIFYPVIILVISFGLFALLKIKTSNKRVVSIFLVATIFLVIFQSIVTILDIQSRENQRYKIYFQNHEVGRQ